MSEKANLELQAHPTLRNPALVIENTTTKPQKNSSRQRLWKALYIIECHFMAGVLHGYAIAHAQKAHLARWDEVMIPDVENLVDWIKLFMVCSQQPRILSFWTFERTWH